MVTGREREREGGRREGRREGEDGMIFEEFGGNVVPISG